MTAPLFADLATAAKLLCMKQREFARLVEEGALPGPCRYDRWDVEQLCSIMRGDPQARQDDLEM